MAYKRIEVVGFPPNTLVRRQDDPIIFAGVGQPLTIFGGGVKDIVVSYD